jgi:putative DNA modification/repair radical SAM protein
VNRVSSEVKRAKFTPTEVVWLTTEFYRRNYIEGLFLSSGIIESSDYTMELLIEVARTLRKQRFGGYIHLKVVAGASQELIHEAGLWADRLSANIEMPVQDDLNLLAPAKTIAAAQGSMVQIKDKVIETLEDKKKSFKFTPKFAPAGQTTQMIVGATSSSDATILNSSEKLYKNYSLRRVYYSAYSPIPHADALLPQGQPMLVRENRLYQADWLLRYYKFEAAELVNPETPNLELDMDPKSSWALRHRSFFPVDINTGTREQLLRVPGLGVKNVERILQMRPYHRITLLDLAKLRVPVNRAKFFVVTADHNPDALLIDSLNLKKRITPAETQLSFFDTLAVDKAGSF